MTTIHLIIKGRVQGVFYRASARDKARELGVTGWVRNTPEGDVEAMVQGKAEVVRQFIDWCAQGPPKAFVREVIQNPVEVVELFHEFLIMR